MNIGNKGRVYLALLIPHVNEENNIREAREKTVYSAGNFFMPKRVAVNANSVKTALHPRVIINVSVNLPANRFSISSIKVVIVSLKGIVINFDVYGFDAYSCRNAAGLPKYILFMRIYREIDRAGHKIACI